MLCSTELQIVGIRASDVNMVEVEPAQMNHPYLKAKTKNKKVGVFVNLQAKISIFLFVPLPRT